MELTHDLVLDAVAPDDEPALREWFELDRAARALDLPDDPSPCWVGRRAELTSPWPGEEPHLWLARAGDTVLGAAFLALPMLDNRGTGLVDLVVAPAHRRAGIGRRLLTHLVEQARAAGRVRLIGEAFVPLSGTSPGASFAAAAGAREALVEVRRLLTLPPDEAALAELETQARATAAGYPLVQWTGGTPERWQADIARLAGRMSTDAPLGELAWEPEHHDAQRVRDRNAMCRARGFRQTVTAARGPAGHLVAFTEISLTASVDDHGAQRNTLVDPEHRGHRLGLLVKIANLRLARELHSGLRVVHTRNAASNRHMIAINEAMGFRPKDRVGEWQLEI